MVDFKSFCGIATLETFEERGKVDIFFAVMS